MQPSTSRTTHVRAVMIAKGDVQRVGYRDAVERIARKMRLTGFVENLKPYDVKIVCEGEKARVEEFIKQVNIREFPIYVEDMDVKFEDATGEFEYFEIRRGDWKEELGERLDSARAELKQNTLILGEFRNESGENSKQILSELREFRNESGENSKQILSELREFRNESGENSKQIVSELREFRNESGENSKQIHSELREFRTDSNENFKLLHSDMVSHDTDAQTRIETLSKEISEIKERLTRVESAVTVQQ